MKLQKGDIIATRASARKGHSRIWTVVNIHPPTYWEGVQLLQSKRLRVDHPNNLIRLANESDFESEDQLVIYKKVMHRIYPPDEYDTSNEDIKVYVGGRWKSLKEVFEMNYGPTTYDL